jgi:hypothetical protein
MMQGNQTNHFGQNQRQYLYHVEKNSRENKMRNINLKNTDHKFEKTNLITITKGGKIYDEMKCSGCGLTGKRYGITDYVSIDGRISEYNSLNCKGKTNNSDEYLGKIVVVIVCTATGPVFNNLKPRSEHKIISPPDGYKNNGSGVWVMGIGQPVKLLSNEFYYKKI